MLYNFIVVVSRGIVRIINGKSHYEYDEAYEPNQHYLVVAPHRSLLDPIFIAFALYPNQVAFMAKDDLFKNKIMGWLLPKLNVFPVNRVKPGASTIKHAAKLLKAGDKNVGLFPTGSRFETQIKSGAASLAKMGKVDLLPVVYQGPIKIKDLFSRKKENRVGVRVGKPIILPETKRLSKEDLALVEGYIQQSFEENDKLLNPNYFYDIEAVIAERDAKLKGK